PPKALVEACGECHRLPPPGGTSDQPERENPESIRFAPVGLMASRCFQASGRLSCLTCHDPPSATRPAPAFYAGKCLGCHTADAPVESACRRAARADCLPCHMPKSSPVPFLTFTDHRIRVVNAPSRGNTAAARLRDSRKYDEAGDPARAVAEAQA